MTPSSRGSSGIVSWALALVVLSLAAGSCAQLGLPPLGGPAAAPIAPPAVTFSGATLARSPSARELAAHYCPELVSAPFGAGPLLCQQAFGPPPPLTALVVSFDLHFHVANPNQVPLPFASALVATTLFPAMSSERLGAACVTLCADGATCNGVPPPGACEASSRDVRSLADFVDKSLPQLLLANGVALANGQPMSFGVPPVVASSQADVTVRYSFGPEQLVAVMKDLVAQSTGELKQGHLPSLAIPYKLEGTIWFDAGSIGRLAVGWGPTQGTFALPIAGLVPAATSVVRGTAPPGTPPAPRGAPPPVP